MLLFILIPETIRQKQQNGNNVRIKRLMDKFIEKCLKE